MRTKAQAQRVAELTDCQVITHDASPTNRLFLPGDFAPYREAVESVSVLFQLASGDGEKVPSG